MSVSSTTKLTEKDQFDAVFANRKILNSKSFKIFLGRGGVNISSRVGISIAKRNVKKAVSRNKIKRIIKESFRQKHNILPARDLVFVVKSGAASISYPELWDELNKKWDDLAVLKF